MELGQREDRTMQIVGFAVVAGVIFGLLGWFVPYDIADVHAMGFANVFAYVCMLIGILGERLYKREQLTCCVAGACHALLALAIYFLARYRLDVYYDQNMHAVTGLSMMMALCLVLNIVFFFVVLIRRKQA